MTSANRQLAGRALELAARCDGMRRQAYLRIGLALETTSSLAGAAQVLEVIQRRDLRMAAQQLLTELAEASTTEVTDRLVFFGLYFPATWPESRQAADG